MKKTLFLLLILYFTSFSASAAIDEAEDRWYEVEILVFSNDEVEGTDDDEAWPEVEVPTGLAQSIVLAPPDTDAGSVVAQDDGVAVGSPVMPYQMLRDSEQKLIGYENRLTRSGQFTPLYHIAWRQPAFPRGSSTPVLIQWDREASENVGEEDEEVALIVPPQMPVVDETDGAGMVPPNAVPEQNLFGSVTVSANRYLHFDVELYYRQDEPAGKEQNIFNIFDVFRMEDTPQVFRMKQTRRMRSGEIHYFDHPRFGMIVQVTPYEYQRSLDADEEGQTASPGMSAIP